LILKFMRDLIATIIVREPRNCGRTIYYWVALPIASFRLTPKPPKI